jgi:hypothetical protein
LLKSPLIRDARIAILVLRLACVTDPTKSISSFVTGLLCTRGGKVFAINLDPLGRDL